MSGVKLLERLARKLPKLRDAHRTLVNHIQAQIDGAHSDLEVRLNICEQAFSPETAPEVKKAFDAVRSAVETVQGLSPRRERLELAQLIDGLLSLLEAPEMTELMRSGGPIAAAEPPELGGFSVNIDTSGLSEAEAVMLVTGMQLGVQLSLSQGSAASVSPAEIKRAIEMHREMQREAQQQPRGLLH
jgi:hypothetical protein